MSDTNGRLDSNFTQLPSFLTKHVTLNGKRLRELDLKNSMPFFAACLFNPTPEVEKIMVRFTYDIYIMRMKSAKLHEREDVKLYTSLVCSGKLYDLLEKEFKARRLRFRDRDHLKERVLKIFCSPNQMCKSQSAAIAFRKLFPTVYGMIHFIKMYKHNRLANLLTKIESRLVLDHVVPAIREKYPDFHFITKHDAIFSPEPKVYTTGNYNLEEVRDIFESTIEDIAGLRPTVKISGKPIYKPVSTKSRREGTNLKRTPYPLTGRIPGNSTGFMQIMERSAYTCEGRAINTTVVHAVITGRIKGSTCNNTQRGQFRPLQRKQIPVCEHELSDNF